MSEHGQDLDTGARVILSPSWVLREEDGGEALLFNADTGDVWVANRTAVAVWQARRRRAHGGRTCSRTSPAPTRGSTRRPGVR